MLVRLILNSWTQVICLPQSPKELRVQMWATAPGRCFHFVTLASPQCRVARGILLSCFLVYFPLQYWSLFNILFGCLSLPTKIYVRCYITSAWHIDSQYLLNEWMNEWMGWKNLILLSSVSSHQMLLENAIWTGIISSRGYTHGCGIAHHPQILVWKEVEYLSRNDTR